MPDKVLEARQQVGRTNAFFPILPRLGNHWASARPWEDHTIGLNLHITPLTAALVNELVLGGASCVVSAASPATTQAGTVALLRDSGVEVYTGGDMENRHKQLLEHDPNLIVDVGFELVHTILRARPELARRLVCAVEMTRTGIDRMRAGERPDFPVLNVNAGRLKLAIENRHGVGEAVWMAVAQLTGMHLAGRRVAVIGYGPVGRGLAQYAKARGMNVEVVERDPVHRLFAHYDGYPCPKLPNALSRVDIIVTATGTPGVLTLQHLSGARDGVVLLNAGHGGAEIDVDGIKRVAERVDNIGEDVVRYRLENGTRITVLGNGHPLNIVRNSGSPEPVLLQHAVVGLALEWAVGQPELPMGEFSLPSGLEERAATLALEALNLAWR